MTTKTRPTAPAIAGHGAARLPAVSVDGYNSELRDEDGFVGDKAKRSAFFTAFEAWRDVMAEAGEDPFGEQETAEISKKEIDRTLKNGSPAGQALVMSATEDYAQALAAVIRRLLRTKEWKDTERIAIGGGLRASRFAEIAVARTELLLREADNPVELRPIRHDPDEAGIVGTIHLAPSWMFKGHDSILGVDIGGSNIRAGLVELNLKKNPDLSSAAVKASEVWRHADEEKLDRDAAVARLVEMLKELVGYARKRELRLAPFIGIGCPGFITPEGTIEAGAQNLPGNWESRRFNLPEALREAIPAIGDEETLALMHNDAVVQGLSEVPFMQDVERWGVLTIGTGLGNARFTNRERPKERGKDDAKKDDGKKGEERKERAKG
ncbi:ROK family protein [Bosea sp. 117]|uniref:ROK family protein n=1 Tax=Bosea sp. 117 TaxID=1125973 RepID=UPI000494CCB8|nr:ROK family protein [Bosea sp. 117]